MGYSLLDEGKSWDVRHKLVELGKQLFSEKFRLMSREDVEKFTDRERVNKLKDQLQKIVSTTLHNLSSTANVAITELEQRGVSIDSFAYGKSGVMGFFIKCAAVDESTTELPSPEGKRVIDALADATGQAWVNKATYTDKLTFAPIERAVIEVLHPALTKLIATISEKQVHFYSAKLILKNLENLALIGDLWSKVRELSREEGFLLLSDSGHLLREFVKESDAPFVYEKVGTRYDMYMIDEFQDTSEVQWHNFKPLIENSLSQDCFSMIVGDVKQSIYRWRNGDWSILASGVENDLRHFGIDDIALSTNWRSLPAIIDFNNRFFTQTRKLAIEALEGKNNMGYEAIIPNLSEQIENAYKDVVQKSPKNGDIIEGMVQLKLFEKENNAG
jgi:ATP-dependent exoDNAse (exonuclease V) beta subunit